MQTLLVRTRLEAIRVNVKPVTPETAFYVLTLTSVPTIALSVDQTPNARTLQEVTNARAMEVL